MEKIRFSGNRITSITYICDNCQGEIDHRDRFCRYCGTELATGYNVKRAYRDGYEAAKHDMIRLLKGGLKNDTE